MIDPLEVLRFALRDFGQAAAIDGGNLENGVLFNHAPAQADPYLDDRGHDGPSCCCLQEDLTAIGQWPLTVKKITTGSVLYNIVRCDNDNGEVTLFLRKAE